MKIFSHKKSCRRIYIVLLFIIASNWKLPKCPSTLYVDAHSGAPSAITGNRLWCWQYREETWLSKNDGHEYYELGMISWIKKKKKKALKRKHDVRLEMKSHHLGELNWQGGAEGTFWVITPYRTVLGVILRQEHVQRQSRDLHFSVSLRQSKDW